MQGSPVSERVSHPRRPRLSLGVFLSFSSRNAIKDRCSLLSSFPNWTEAGVALLVELGIQLTNTRRSFSNNQRVKVE